jgi:hypothetical protein
VGKNLQKEQWKELSSIKVRLIIVLQETWWKHSQNIHCDNFKSSLKMMEAIAQLNLTKLEKLFMMILKEKIFLIEQWTIYLIMMILEVLEVALMVLFRKKELLEKIR